MVTRKSPVAWKKVCLPKKQGDLQVINLVTWSKACLLKLLWNLSCKKDTLWVKWIHAYYMPLEHILTHPLPLNSSWIMKGIMKCRPLILNNHAWTTMSHLPRYVTQIMYKELQGDAAEVNWKILTLGSLAWPRAQLIAWLACHGRLATRERLQRFGLIDTSMCCFCTQIETLEHLMFECHATRIIWQQVLGWLRIQHVPDKWSNELQWVLLNCKGKSWRRQLLKVAFLETIYEIWRHRNNICFNNIDRHLNIAHQIIDVIIYRSWRVPRLRTHVGRLMIT